MQWIFDQESINWDELSNLYRIEPLGAKNPEDLKIAFSNSRYKCFVFDNEKLIGVGRALADGFVCVFNYSNTTSITRTWRLIREETNLPSQHAINEPVKVSGACARDSNKFHRLKPHSSVQYDTRTMFLCSCLPGCRIIGWDSDLTV